MYKNGIKLKIILLVTASLVNISIPSSCFATSSTRQEIQEAEQEKGQLEDQRDANRSTAPLRQAEDAILADTTELDLDQSLALLIQIVKERLQA